MSAVRKKTETSVVDDMADDAALPDEYPPGAPDLIPFLKLRPRSRRAEFKRKMAELEPIKDRIEALRESGVMDPDNETITTVDRVNASADLDEMYQLMDDLLVLAAANPDAYRSWSDELDDDNQLTAVFNVYMRRTQPGEASSSTS